ncbi:ATP-binding cassette domain-containing protein [Nocardioides sp. W3-2-3]|nr:ATP-binding cassette domain-containing protein [Nocardioides convexus]
MSTTPAIEAIGLGKHHGGVRAVADLSFAVRPGAVTGFLGPNGAGKSTTLRLLTGLDRPSAGRVLVDGRPLTEWPEPGRKDRRGARRQLRAPRPDRTRQHPVGLPARRRPGRPR